jgi:hypothetical protein
MQKYKVSRCVVCPFCDILNLKEIWCAAEEDAFFLGKDDLFPAGCPIDNGHSVMVLRCEDAHD